MLISKTLMEFSEEQQKVLDKYMTGENIFITGPGGTGKSAIIREIYKDAIQKKKEIRVCALTGCAAVLLQCNAKTVHSWAGVGQASGTIEDNVKKVIKNKFKKSNWLNTDILVVDEVSMMSRKLFNMLNTLGKKARKCSSKPFGGIQVIFSGDFFQLPPVGDADEPETSQFCFESEEWSEVFPKQNQITLVKIFRQQDNIYSTILNQLREGKLKRSSYDILMKHVGKTLPDTSEIRPTKLYPKRHSVDSINNMEMSQLTTEHNVYTMKRAARQANPSGMFTEKDVEYEYSYLEKSINTERQICLKVGAQVMCIVNMDTSSGHQLCNGSQGIITRFNEQKLPVVKFSGIPTEIVIPYHTWGSETIPGVAVSQIPLILAWALTIHKAQGATLALAEIDVGDNVFACGQTYVALSRVKSLDGLYLTAFNYNKILVNKKVKEFYSQL